MISEATIQTLLGLPYTEEHDCKWLVRHFLALENICLQVEIEEARRGFKFVKPPARYLDVAYFKTTDPREHHIGVMLDQRWCLQSSESTGGIARINITRPHWRETLQGFVRHKSLCF